MDDIEIKVMETLEKHAWDLGKEEEARIKWMKAETDFFYKMNPAAQGGATGGGFLDNLIKGISGSRLGSSLAGGIAGGLTAGIVMGLTNAIIDLTKQSKILGQIHSKLQDLLGLLIDMILIPFLPLILGAMMTLYSVIYKWGLAWQKQNVLPTVTKENKLDVGTLSTIMPGPANVIPKLLEAYTNMAVDLGLFFNKIGIWASGIPMWWDKNVTQPFIDGAWVIKNWSDGLRKWWDTWVTQPFINGAKTIKTWADTIGKLWEEYIVTPYKNFLNALSQGLTNLINGLYATLRRIPFLGTLVPEDFPAPTPLATGGFIERTGIALVHQGETVTPAGQGGGETHFHFYGYDDAKLQRSVENILRRQNNRYQA